MRAQRAGKPKVKVGETDGSDATPAHMIYRTKFLEASIGYQRDRKKCWDHKEGVSACIGEENWEHSGVYLSIYSKHRLSNGSNCEGAFEDFISIKQLDDIIELLQLLRAKADSLGILTPRKIPPAKSA